MIASEHTTHTIGLRHHLVNHVSNHKHTNTHINALIAHNTRHQHLHIILVFLLLFCMFLLISLCSPTTFGIDDTFQDVYYPTLHTDTFLFVYGPLINRHFRLREHIKYTPKAKRKNPYILHDHFDPNSIDSDDSDADDDVYAMNYIDDGGGGVAAADSDSDLLSSMPEYPVRIHHLRRGFYFDTSFNDVDSEQFVRFKNIMDLMSPDNDNDDDYKSDAEVDAGSDGDIHDRLNYSYTALGVQFDADYEMTVNGLLLRIDEEALLQFDVKGAGMALRREIVPLQWIDFLYGKPKEFARNTELEQEKLQTIQKANNAQMDSNNNNESGSLLKQDVDDANSMIQHVDIAVYKQPVADVDDQAIDSQSSNHENGEDVMDARPRDDESNEDDGDMENEHELDSEIALKDLVDVDQGLIVEDIHNVQKQKQKQQSPPINPLNAINEKNDKYQLKVFTYIVPNEIMIDGDQAQFARIMKQSYIDVTLSGCLDIGGKEFAKEFIQSTYGWTPFKAWNDDRGHSKHFYDEEQFITSYEYEKIDMLLKKFVFGTLKTDKK